MESNWNVQYQTNCRNQCRDISLKSSCFFFEKNHSKFFLAILTNFNLKYLKNWIYAVFVGCEKTLCTIVFSQNKKI